MRPIASGLSDRLALRHEIDRYRPTHISTAFFFDISLPLYPRLMNTSLVHGISAYVNAHPRPLMAMEANSGSPSSFQALANTARHTTDSALSEYVSVRVNSSIPVCRCRLNSFGRQLATKSFARVVDSGANKRGQPKPQPARAVSADPLSRDHSLAFNVVKERTYVG